MVSSISLQLRRKCEHIKLSKADQTPFKLHPRRYHNPGLRAAIPCLCGPQNDGIVKLKNTTG